MNNPKNAPSATKTTETAEKKPTRVYVTFSIVREKYNAEINKEYSEFQKTTKFNVTKKDFAALYLNGEAEKVTILSGSSVHIIDK